MKLSSVLRVHTDSQMFQLCPSKQCCIVFWSPRFFLEGSRCYLRCLLRPEFPSISTSALSVPKITTTCDFLNSPCHDQVVSFCATAASLQAFLFPRDVKGQSECCTKFLIAIRGALTQTSYSEVGRCRIEVKLDANPILHLSWISVIYYHNKGSAMAISDQCIYYRRLYLTISNVLEFPGHWKFLKLFSYDLSMWQRNRLTGELSHATEITKTVRKPFELLAAYGIGHIPRINSIRFIAIGLLTKIHGCLGSDNSCS